MLNDCVNIRSSTRILGICAPIKERLYSTNDIAYAKYKAETPVGSVFITDHGFVYNFNELK